MRLSNQSILERWVKRGCCLFLVAGLLATVPAVAAGEGEQTPVKFRWAFGALTDDGTTLKLGLLVPVRLSRPATSSK